MSNLVFFGAGASKPFGIPTMQEMVSDFENNLKKDDALYNFYSQVKNVLVKEYGDSKVDVESMLSVFDGISTGTKPVQLGHFICYYASKNCANVEFSTNEIFLANALKQKLYSYIKNKCKVHIEQTKVYKMSYLPFFQHMEGEKHDYGESQLCNNWKAYTTNYDNIFENFWRMLEPPVDHFKKSTNSHKDIFKTTSLNGNHTFSKLHGSLDWTREVSSRNIVRVEPGAYSPVEIKGDVMLFPIQQKDLYRHPWFTLFQDLKTGLSSTQKWYVIGYAFNDEFIRNVFQESLVDDVSKKLILINPEAEEIKDKFSGNVQNQIDALPMRFGGEYFEHQFREYTESVMTIVVRFKTTNTAMNYKIKIESDYNITSINNLSSEDVELDDLIIYDYGSADRPNFVYIKTKDQKHNAEIQLELKIDYDYSNKIELRISGDTKIPDFVIDYNGKTIFYSNSVFKEIIESKDHKLELIRVQLTNIDLYNNNFLV